MSNQYCFQILHFLCQMNNRGSSQWYFVFHWENKSLANILLLIIFRVLEVFMKFDWPYILSVGLEHAQDELLDAKTRENQLTLLNETSILFCNICYIKLGSYKLVTWLYVCSCILHIIIFSWVEFSSVGTFSKNSGFRQAWYSSFNWNILISAYFRSRLFCKFSAEQMQFQFIISGVTLNHKLEIITVMSHGH